MFRSTIRKQVHFVRDRLYYLATGKSRRPTQPTRQEWSIGIYVGAEPLGLHAPAGFNNPVLTRCEVSDVSAAFVADPFMIHTDDKWHMFFEVLNKATGNGQIGSATSDDGFQWEYRRIVLDEPFHLSYPYVFEWDGEHYMIPESYQAGSVRLYKATRFPDEWSFECTLLQGGVFLDPSVVHYDGKWWLFVETNPEHRYDTLRLFYANALKGRWQEHPMSPVVVGNNRMSRPAGRVQVANGRLLRFAQDCLPFYGTRVRAFDISELTTTAYRESECHDSPVLGPTGNGWNRSGMHHMDVHHTHDGGWIACVDGFVLNSPRA